MKSENDSTHETVSENVVILDFDAQFADEILDIQTECGLSAWSKNDYLDALEREDSIFKIALSADEKIVGFALARLLINSNAPNLEIQKDASLQFDSSEILNVAVRNSFRQKGVGQIIFDEILRELEIKNIPEIWLEVRKSNVQAINFYQKNNFKSQFERKNYYTDPTENACVLRSLMGKS